MSRNSTAARAQIENAHNCTASMAQTDCIFVIYAKNWTYEQRGVEGGNFLTVGEPAPFF